MQSLPCRTNFSFTGDITKFAWNDYKLYILLDGIFYEFDIYSFYPPAFDDDGNINYKLKEYTREEFEIIFPDNRAGWDWYTS